MLILRPVSISIICRNIDELLMHGHMKGILKIKSISVNNDRQKSVKIH